MEAQWQPTFSPTGYTGPSFRRGPFVAAAQRDETQLRWHVFRTQADESLERLWSAEMIQEWNAGESVHFPLEWTDRVLAEAGWS
jgi:hypothetical protein